MTDTELQVAIDRTREFINCVTSSNLQQGAREQSKVHLRALEETQVQRAQLASRIRYVPVEEAE